MSKVTQRRKNAHDRLEAQLKSGKKNVKKSVLPLTEIDKTRIEKEIGILKNKI